MKKYKVYQLRRENENIIDDYHESYDARMKVIAEYEISSDRNDPVIISEDIWQMCNVHCWDHTWSDGQVVTRDDIILTPTSDFDGFVNSDIVVETADGLYLAESCGFMKVDSLNYAMHRITVRFPFISYYDIRNKEDFNEDLLRDIRNEIQKEYQKRIEE